MFVAAVAVISIAVWLIVFPMVLVRGPAGAFSGERSATLCIAGGEAHADTDIVRFMRRFHYLGVRAEVRTGGGGEMCFLLTLARRIPQVVDAVLRKGELRVFPIQGDQSSLFPESDAIEAGLERNSDRLGPVWSATTAAPVERLIARRKGDLTGPAYAYCRQRRCTGVLAEADLIASGTDVMSAFPINTDAGEPALLLRLAPPALQRITARTEKGPVSLGFVVDGRLLSVTSIPSPEADGQVTVLLDRTAVDVKFEAAILASILSSGAIDGKWRRTDLKLAPESRDK